MIITVKQKQIVLYREQAKEAILRVDAVAFEDFEPGGVGTGTT